MQPHSDELGKLAEGLSIRDATPDDADAIAAIYNESVDAADCTFDLEHKPAHYFAVQIRGFGQRETILLLEDQAGVEPSTTGPLPAVLGWGVIKRYSDRQGYRFCCETGVYLWRRHVRKGYGSMIKRALLERCREYRYHHLVAKVVAGNTAGIEYNRRFGYKIVGTQREIGFVKGRWEDVVLMQLVLEDVQPGGMEPGY